MNAKLVITAIITGMLLACSKGNGRLPPVLSTILVTPSSPSVTIGTAQQFAATGTYSDGSSKDLTATASWASSDTTIATVDSGGLAQSVSAGTAMITASSGGVSNSAPLTVRSPAVTYDVDADGFLWGTEGNVNTADANNLPSAATAASNAINTTLQTKYVKFRISQAFFTTTDSGVTYSSAYCLPKASQCSVSFDMDEVAKLYEANGWSMIPMLRIDETRTISTAVIDDYVNFVDWFVGRYKTQASIEMIELVNSPSARTWHGTDAQLVELTNKTYDRVKSKYPEVSVGTPGFEYWLDATTDPDGSPVTANVAYFLDKNNGAKFDFWAFHGYGLRPMNGAQLLPIYPPTKSAVTNVYGGIPGILQVRAAMDANGWQNRKIIDTEHDNITEPGQTISVSSDALDAAYVVQELVLKRTLASGGTRAVSGALALKMAPRGTIGEAGLSSLNTDGSVTQHVKAMALLWSKLKDYPYAGHVSGAIDDENQVWIEKFASGKRELYIFFKPFKYVSGQKIALDGQTLNYTLSLSAVPASITQTDINGSAAAVTPSQNPTLAAENSPKFLEISYP